MVTGGRETARRGGMPPCGCTRLQVLPDRQTDHMKSIDAEQEPVWSLLPRLRYVRLQLPPLPVEGLPTPINIHLDFDAGTVDEMLDRLTVLRAQMLPKPPGAKKRN